MVIMGPQGERTTDVTESVRKEIVLRICYMRNPEASASKLTLFNFLIFSDIDQIFVFFYS